ncbi:MAG: hypothetical protein PHE56_00570 [Bacteroidales bacterium]|nr:hypothetical protein [Bacteroidales bacterium]
MNKAILLTIGLLMSVLCFAQETVIIGTGTSSQYLMPINRAANYAASEMIYLQSEIGYAGDIEKISFYKASGLIGVTIENINIYMKHTSSSTLATGTTSLRGYTLVYSGTYPNSISKGWIEITLSTPFNYNNTDNLQLFITKGYQASVTTQPYYSYTSTGSYNRSRYYSNSTVAWNDRASLTASTQRPNIQLYVTPLIECDSTTFIDAGSVSPISTTLYNNYVASLNLPNYTFLGGLDRVNALKC